MMNEDFLHFLWKKQLLGTDLLLGTQKEKIRILDPGEMNNDAGPDFFNSKVKIDGILWAGNVEIHIKSSDWIRHRHKSDPVYNSVILHVVLKDDKPIARNDGQLIPTLVVQPNQKYFNKYIEIIKSRLWIPCEKELIKGTRSG